MTLTEFKLELAKRGLLRHFFDWETLKFFGERESEMRILKKKVRVRDYQGYDHICYVLSTYQRNHPVAPGRYYYYFDEQTFERVFSLLPVHKVEKGDVYAATETEGSND